MTSLRTEERAAPWPRAIALTGRPNRGTGLAKGATPVLEAVSYAFSSEGRPFGHPGPLRALGAAQQTGGMFTVCPPADPSRTTPNGCIVYPACVRDLCGSVGKHTFSHAQGHMVVGNGVALSAFDPHADLLQIGVGAAPQPEDPDLEGFEVADFRLVNLRLLWIDPTAARGADGHGSQPPPTPPTPPTPPRRLPARPGRLALDFVRADQPDGPRRYVFFDDVLVTALRGAAQPRAGRLGEAAPGGAACQVLPMQRRPGPGMA